MRVYGRRNKEREIGRERGEELYIERDREGGIERKREREREREGRERERD